MGEFVLQIDDGRPFVVPNTIADEGSVSLYKQIFPTLTFQMQLQIGIAGPDTEGPDERPQPTGGGYPIDSLATDAALADANEGGGYTDEMRDSFGYARATPVFAASLETGGGYVECEPVEFTNTHSWTPQDGDAWDDPSTTPDVEQPPPEWGGRRYPDPKVGFPWHFPRKLDATIGTGPTSDSYMSEWDSSGDLDWLADFRKIGGFPVTAVFLRNDLTGKIVAIAELPGPVLLWPGSTLRVAYRARAFSVAGHVTGAFLHRWMQRAFAMAGSPYNSILIRPVGAGFSGMTADTAWADVEPWFTPEFAAVTLATWDHVPGPPHKMRSATAPSWPNATGDDVGPVTWLIVYGEIEGEGAEVMWGIPVSPSIVVPDGDTLAVPAKVSFSLVGV